jgi:DNA repair protein RadA
MKLEELKTMTSDLANKLKSLGIQSVESLAIRSISEIRDQLEGVSEKKLKQVFMEVWRHKGFWFMTASKINEVRGERIAFTTGSEALDQMLGGGVYTREITEFAGEYGVGKSQLLYTIIVEALNKHKDAAAVFLDSEDTFRLERVSKIAESRGYDAEDILSRIIYIPIVDTDLFFLIIDRLDTTIENRNVKLIASDSIIAPLRAEYVGREVLWLRQQILNKILRRLLNLAKVYNLAVIISNQVVTSPQATFSYDPIAQKTPTGGNIIAHNCNCRVYIRKSQANKRIARLIDSSWLPEQECVFCITEKGIEDVGA